MSSTHKNDKPSTKEVSSSAAPTTSKKRRNSKKQSLVQPPYHLFPPNHGLNDEKISFQDGIQSILNILQHRKNIVVLCGAGISVSCGIPDFRSKGGIYDMIGTFTNDLGLSTPEEIFHYEIFQDDPRPFYKFASQMLYDNDNDKKRYEPSASHRFLALLEEKKMLRRVYTQNIDGLEELAGISKRKIVYAHGSLNESICLKCGRKVDVEEVREEILNGHVPLCRRVVGRRRKRQRGDRTECQDGAVTAIGTGASSALDSSTAKLQNNNRREEEENTINIICDGVMKPNIIFFGEPLVDKVRRCLEADQSKADAVIVIGTSLSVAPISKVIEYLKPNIPRILINDKIVVPKHVNGEGIEEEGDDDGSSSEGHEHIEHKDKGGKDHRDGYLFDAIMLGFCDEVTKALSYVLRKGDGKVKNYREESIGSTSRDPNDDLCTSTSSRKRQKIESNKIQPSKCQKSPKLFPFQSDDCDVLCNNTNALEKMNSTYLRNHPTDRILLFSGAKLFVQPIEFGIDGNHNEEVVYQEVVHCDECHQIIQKVIMKCTDCFDYDLCKKCYEKVSRSDKHYGGTHKFVMEKCISTDVVTSKS